MMFKDCINLVKAENEPVSYCMKFKLEIDRCPSQCGYYSKGVPGDIEETRKKKLNFECLYLARVNNEHRTPVYVCSLMNLQNPPCQDCSSAEFAVDRATFLNI